MIRKIWVERLPNYDRTFDLASDNLWAVWKEEMAKSIISPKNTSAFKKRFNYKPIVNINGGWEGLIFKNKAEYMLFLLEWS
jgi:hypothetical protein